MKKILVILLISFLAHKSLASNDKKIKIQVPLASIDFQDGLNSVMRQPVEPAEIFSRTQAVLDHFKIPAEPSYQSEIQSLSGKQTLEGLNNILPAFDATKQFDRFSAFQKSTSTLAAFQDRDSRETPDFNVTLAEAMGSASSLIAKGPADRPLLGLKVALDPGHMGSETWDLRTGKYVTDHHNHTVSEGLINLQTCLLLKARLEKLGATVLVTHETLGPVTKIPWEELNLGDYIPDELNSQTLESWFQTLVAKAPAGPVLFSAFDKSPYIKKIYSEDMRSDFFILIEDLHARAKLIEEFKPQITLIIHYDTSDPAGDTNGVGKKPHDYTKAYVPGGYLPTELASRILRKDFAKHVLNPAWWNDSVKLASSILNEMESTLKLKPDPGNDGEAVVLLPGLQARNLALTHLLSETALAYIECLYYNDPTEFKAFSNGTHTIDIGGENYLYSDRLIQVVDALESGVVNFVKNH
jgi:N-acetylmuramoyl-L-alanine amidase